MKDFYNSWYKHFQKSIDSFDSDELYDAVHSLLLSSKNTIAFNRKIMEKSIDVSWVEAIESGMVHLDNVLRNPRRTIEDVEEIVPIALSKKITVESVKHLAQHTDYIQSIDKRGRIMPSKILNVHKEDSLFTYENKFVNTLVDRLYIFINRRYEKLAEVKKDEEIYTIEYDTALDNKSGKKMNISMRIETENSLESTNSDGYTVWERVEKIRKAIDGYKSSVLCRTLDNVRIRPPVMRTNAIMKNIDLKACLTLWQYIESYEQAGFEINISNSAKKPDSQYIDDMYKLAVLNFILFNSYTATGGESAEELKSQKSKTLSPKLLKKFDKETAEKYAVSAYKTDGSQDTSDNNASLQSSDTEEIAAELDLIIAAEKQYIIDEEERQIVARKAAAQAEQKRQEEENKRLEKERIEEEMRLERERIEREKEEEERRVQEMLERKRAEQEAAEKAAREERERLEREEQEKREAELKKAEEERKQREEEERIEAEKEKIREEKRKIREKLGIAEDEEIPQEDTDAQQEPEEIESPEVAARRAKEQQQQREIERKENERAQKLKAERARIESKSFDEIYREYSKNPFYLVPRVIYNTIITVFGIIPENTDNPDLRHKLEVRKAEQLKAEEEKKKQMEMEVLYEKYAQTFRYRSRRFIANVKFKRKRKRDNKNRPRPVYTPPVRTAEEQQAINDLMKRLYKEYHVGIIEKIKRRIEDATIKRNMQK